MAQYAELKFTAAAGLKLKLENGTTVADIEIAAIEEELKAKVYEAIETHLESMELQVVFDDAIVCDQDGREIALSVEVEEVEAGGVTIHTLTEVDADADLSMTTV